MPTVVTPTERWFIKLCDLRDCVANINHATPKGLKNFLRKTVSSLISVQQRGTLGVCCQSKNVSNGPISDGAFADGNDFAIFLDMVSGISIVLSLRSQMFQIAVKHKPELITVPPAKVLKMNLDEIFGDKPLNANLGKKELDLVLNQITPDDFYPTDGSLLNDGSVSLNFLVEKITG